ncbi:hypothetical protein BC940DRAFT_114597 [Gongronella butleri]|nr:hypothetical protein BC940DRAFT_114597 [Gongronella butleri]
MDMPYAIPILPFSSSYFSFSSFFFFLFTYLFMTISKEENLAQVERPVDFMAMTTNTMNATLPPKSSQISLETATNQRQQTHDSSVPKISGASDSMSPNEFPKIAIHQPWPSPFFDLECELANDAKRASQKTTSSCNDTQESDVNEENEMTPDLGAENVAMQRAMSDTDRANENPERKQLQDVESPISQPTSTTLHDTDGSKTLTPASTYSLMADMVLLIIVALLVLVLAKLVLRVALWYYPGAWHLEVDLSEELASMGFLTVAFLWLVMKDSVSKAQENPGPAHVAARDSMIHAITPPAVAADTDQTQLYQRLVKKCVILSKLLYIDAMFFFAA